MNWIYAVVCMPTPILMMKYERLKMMIFGVRGLWKVLKSWGWSPHKWD